MLILAWIWGAGLREGATLEQEAKRQRGEENRVLENRTTGGLLGKTQVDTIGGR